jgi:hypothetical protein
MCIVKRWNINQPRLMLQNSEKGGGNEMKNSRKMAK